MTKAPRATRAPGRSTATKPSAPQDQRTKAAAELAQARDPRATAARLQKLAKARSLDVRLAVVAHPSTPRACAENVVGSLAYDSERDQKRAAVVLLKDPELARSLAGSIFVETALAMVRSESLEPQLWEAFWGHYSRRVKVALVSSPLAPRGSLARLCPQAETLDLRSEELFDKGLAELLRSDLFAAITTLDLRDNRIERAGWKALASSTTFPRLTSLDLSDNFIDAASARALARGAALSRLTSLDLSRDSLEEEGAKALAQATALHRLTTLRLSGNAIGDTGVRALARSTAFRRLATLDLSDNGIGEAGAEALARSTEFPLLTSLDLSGNEVTRAGVSALARAWPCCAITSRRSR